MKKFGKKNQSDDIEEQLDEQQEEQLEEQPEEQTPEKKADERLKRRKRARRKAFMRFVDRVFLFFLVTGIMAGIGGLALEYVIVKGPSPALRDTFISTMLETRRFDFVANVFLTEEEIKEFKRSQKVELNTVMDASIINISANNPSDESDSPYVEDEDGDGIVFENITGNGYVGYMLTILDPTRVFVGSGVGVGLTLEQMCAKYDALGGINGGGFFDDNGAGMGDLPLGLTIIDGVCYTEGFSGDPIAGFTADGLMYVGYYSQADAEALGIVNCVSFGPLLIMNGESVFSPSSTSGVNPRTAIGQRADGAVLMLVIDGRQAHSIGASHQDVVNIMLDHGAVNACSMDGGSSTTMFYEGRYVNSVSASYGTARPLPSAFLFK